MIYFNDKNNQTITSSHVNCPLGKSFNIDEVDSVEASFDELQRCGEILGRKVNSNYHMFYGDEARTIAANWDLKR